MVSISSTAGSDLDTSPPGRDGRTDEFRRFLRVATPAGFGFAAFEIVLGLVFGDPAALFAGLTAAVYVAGALVWIRGTLARRPIEGVVNGILLPMYIPIAASAILQPGGAVLGAVLPIAIAMSYLDRREMRRVTAVALITVVVITVANDLGLASTAVPAWILLPLRLSGAIAILALVAILVWQFRNRLQRTADELRRQAFHDALTGLANRNLLLDRLEHAVARRPGPNAGLNAVLFLDLDDFKAVNDNIGHAGGDRLLVAVAERLLAGLRPSDTAARLGGDEFAILLEDLRVGDEANQVARRLIDDLAAPFRIDEATVFIGTSVGIALSERGASSAEDLLRNADFAMYRAKTLGKGRFEVFRTDLHDAATRETALREQLGRAIEQDELRVHYQPIVDLASGAVLGVEALARWQRPDGSVLMPDDFIPLAEESGLILPIGAWILERACQDARAWQARHELPGLFVSVNLSARQFGDHGLDDRIAGSLAASGLDPSALVLEITESVLMQTGAATVDRLTELRRLGIRLALDDFGTGYSSLSYLERFPVDILKVDRSFVARMGEKGFRPVIARAVVQLGKGLGLDVVAEGIERPEQAAMLRRLGCSRGQGNLYAEPLAADDVEPLLHRGHVDVPDDRPSGPRPIPIRRRSRDIA